MKVYYTRYESQERNTGTGHPYKWYLAWTREYPSGWSVDRMYLLSSIATLQPGCPFWELPWSSCKHDGLTVEGAMDEMSEIRKTRTDHGYILVSSGVAVYDDDGHMVSTEEYPYDI